MPVTSIDQIKVALTNVIRKASSVNAVIEANQGQPPPEGIAYATYNITPIRAYGQVRRERALIPAEEPGPTPDYEDFAETVVSQLQVMVSINFFNNGALDAAMKLHNASFRQPVREMLYAAGIGWRTASEIRDLTGLYQAEMQPRYQCDVQLFIETAITDTILKAAGFSLVIEDENGNTIFNGGT